MKSDTYRSDPFVMSIAPIQVLFGKTEVDHFYCVISFIASCEHDIFMLQVAVDDVSVMKINDGAQDLFHHVAGLCLRVRAPGV